MKKIILLAMVALVLMMTSCVTHTHVVGAGPQGGSVQSKQQWYALWGVVPIGEVDTNKMAGNSPNYEIKTYYGFVDVVISIFLGPLSIASRTVVVRK